jgi:hypothetical protein
MHARASKTRYFEKFKINISTRRIQTKLSRQKRLNEYYTTDEKVTKSLEDIQLFLNMKYRMFGQAVSKYYMTVSFCVMVRQHLTPFERLFCENFNDGFRLKGG